MTPLLAAFALTAAAPAHHTFAVSGSQLLLDGEPFRVRSGEMHYARVPRQYWRDRFRKIKALGLNTVCTYIFWNLQEPQPGHFDFTGNQDVREFVKEAQEEGLWVLLRPGPYACAEWEWGGFPYWLDRIPNLKVRSDDPRFLHAARGYLKALGQQLADLQINHGGPILMTQVENEYGSFGHDMRYKSAIRDALRAAGFDGQLYTADGPSQSMFSGGTLPDVLPTANFGGDPEGAFKELERFRPGTPKICGEFYPGWFDSWGKPHAHTSVKGLVSSIEWMESNGASYSLYMVHGGSSFGFMNGANWYDNGYWPQTTSYDYSTVLDESGRPTEKYWAFRKVMESHLAQGEKLPEVPESPPTISVAPFSLHPVGSVFDLLSQARRTKNQEPLRFEALGQAYGFVLYRTVLDRQVKGDLTLVDLQDRAQVFADGGLVGTAYRSGKPTEVIPVDIPAGTRLDILVENCGRINYGPKLLGEHAGLGRVLLDGQELAGWDMYSLPMSEPPAPHVAAHTAAAGIPAVFQGQFDVPSPGDTFLDMRGWGKGVVWVNGHNLGRYWHIGPQQTLYLPGPWLKARANDVTVFELEPARRPGPLKCVAEPVWELPPKSEVRSGDKNG